MKDERKRKKKRSDGGERKEGREGETTIGR